LLVREPLAFIEEYHPELFDRIGGSWEQSGWPTISYTAFLLGGEFRGVVVDEPVLAKLTARMWFLRVFYALAASAIALVALQ